MKILHLATAAILALTLSTIHADTATQVSKLGISGWYSECDLITPDWRKSCIGDYVVNDEPAALDPTGNTCYVNPLETSNTSLGVYWLGPTSSQTGIYIYSMLLLGNDTQVYQRTDCNANGSCSCDAVEPYRGEWRNGSCGGVGVSCSRFQVTSLQGLVGKDCAAIFQQTIENYYGLVGSCFVAGTLVDMTATPTVSPSPTTPPAPTSGVKKVHHTCSLSGFFLMVGLASAFVY